MHHLGDPGHADTADADEVDRTDLGTHRLHAGTPSPLGARLAAGWARPTISGEAPPAIRSTRSARSLVACGRPTDSARSAALAERLRIARNRFDLLGQHFRRELGLLDHPCPARLGHFARIGGLMVVRGDRQRDEDCRPSGGGQFGDGRGPCPGNDQMRLADAVRHVFDIGQQLGRDIERGIAVAHGLDVVRPALLHDLEAVTQLGRQHPKRIGHHLAQHGRALASAGDQYLERRGFVELGKGHGPQPGHGLPHRVTDQFDLSPVRRLQPVDFGIGGGDRRRRSGQQPIDPAQHRILLVQDGRNSHRIGRQQRWEGGIAAEADHRVGRILPVQPLGLPAALQHR